MHRSLVSVLVLLALLSSVHSSSLTFTKKGVGYGSNPSSDAAICNDLRTFNISWYYNWGVTPSCVARVNGVEFIPMIWNDRSLPLTRPLPAGSDWLLGFNEPNFRGQAEMAPAYAAALWPQLEATGRRLVGPAVADCGGVGGPCTYSSILWYQHFMGNCTGCRIDAVSIHLYYCNADDMMNKIAALYSITQRPIWLSEFACDAPNSPDQPTTFAQTLLPQLEASRIVQRYAWYLSFCGGCGAGDLLYSSLLLDQLGQGNLSPVGTYYSALTSTRPNAVTLNNPFVSIDAGQLSPSVDGDGRSWLADQSFDLGSTIITSTNAVVGSASTQYMFQTFRSGNSIRYSIPVSAQGTYLVTLYFSEPQVNSVGARLFDVSIQSQVIERSFDIFNRTGSRHTSMSVLYPTSVTAATSLTVTIQLTSVVNTALIAALSVAPASATPLPADTKGPVYINCGGSPDVDAAGRQWVSSAGYASGGTSSSVNNQIAGAPADQQFIYQSNLYGSYRVSIPMASGSYNVSMMFSENYWQEATSRVFNILVQNQVVRPGFDIFALAGGRFRGYKFGLTVNIQPTLPQLIIELVSLTDYGLLSGVSVNHVDVPISNSSLGTGGSSSSSPSVSSSSSTIDQPGTRPSSGAPLTSSACSPVDQSSTTNGTPLDDDVDQGSTGSNNGAASLSTVLCWALMSMTVVVAF